MQAVLFFSLLLAKTGFIVKKQVFCWTSKKKFFFFSCGQVEFFPFVSPCCHCNLTFHLMRMSLLKYLAKNVLGVLL